jgi:hypothetical protein
MSAGSNENLKVVVGKAKPAKVKMDTEQLRTDAQTVSELLMKLQDYPLFIMDVAADDPDLDLEAGFKFYEKLRQADGN